MQDGMERIRRRCAFEESQRVARGILNVDLGYEFGSDGLPVADSVVATVTVRGGGKHKRTKQSENRLYSVEDFSVGETIEVRYPHDNKWYMATVISRTRGKNPQLRVNYVGFNEEGVVDPIDSCRKSPLVEGWIELTDDSSGHLYYLHGLTGETRWDRPTKLTESVRRGAVGRGTRITNRVNKDVYVKEKEKPYHQRHHTSKTDPHYRERNFHLNSMSRSDIETYNDRRKSFAGETFGGYKGKEKIIDDQRKRRASFSSVATRSISSSQLPVCNYYHDQAQTSAKNKFGWRGSMGDKRHTTLGQR